FPFYSLYETKDGRWLSVATVEPKFWSRMCELIGAPDLAEKQFKDGAERFAVAQTLAERFRGRTLAEWEALLANENLPIAGVKRVSEVVRDPQVEARGLLPVVDVSGLWKLQVIAHPAKHRGRRPWPPSRGPHRWACRHRDSGAPSPGGSRWAPVERVGRRTRGPQTRTLRSPRSSSRGRSRLPRRR